ncbi:MAG: hypothetical protein KH020_11850, partial [Clostridiales bacterium]|nr:hypothetical protein [Clostridiales bacterium]
MNLRQWQLILIELLKLVEVEEYEPYCKTMKQLLGEDSAYYQQLLFRFLEQDLLDRQMSGEELKKCLERYTKAVIDYYENLYQEEMKREENRYLLQGEYAFALYYQESCQESFDQIECLKKAKDSYPRMLVAIKRYMEYLLKEYDEKRKAGNEEFRQLGAQVKIQIKQMIAQRQYGVALPILMQLLSLMPNDLELLRLKQMILTGN